MRYERREGRRIKESANVIQREERKLSVDNEVAVREVVSTCHHLTCGQSKTNVWWCKSIVEGVSKATRKSRTMRINYPALEAPFLFSLDFPCDESSSSSTSASPSLSSASSSPNLPSPPFHSRSHSGLGDKGSRQGWPGGSIDRAFCKRDSRLDRSHNRSLI